MVSSVTEILLLNKDKHKLCEKFRSERKMSGKISGKVTISINSIMTLIKFN